MVEGETRSLHVPTCCFLTLPITTSVTLFLHAFLLPKPMFSTFFCVCVRGRVRGGDRSWVFLCSLGSPLTEIDPVLPSLPKCWDLLPNHMRGGCFYFFLWLLIEQLFKKVTAVGRALSHLPSSWSAGYSLCIMEPEFG